MYICEQGGVDDSQYFEKAIFFPSGDTAKSRAPEV
jgi:hypothetical protein